LHSVDLNPACLNPSGTTARGTGAGRPICTARPTGHHGLASPSRGTERWHGHRALARHGGAATDGAMVAGPGCGLHREHQRGEGVAPGIFRAVGSHRVSVAVTGGKTQTA
jgi:hypothetical protein